MNKKLGLMQDTADFCSPDPIPVTKKDIPPLANDPKIAAQAHLYPIDETEEFHDPFSDLSLFLSKKIKTEVAKCGSSKEWSHKIQNDLITKILPEFKIQFPKYRLGVSALKRVWEKVSYYYGKIQPHQEAIGSDGHLNVPFMIKENLKSIPNHPSSIPQHNIAHQLAVKISECIATLDGRRPRLDHLTKTIWAAQKHLIKSCDLQKNSSSYEDHDLLDKLIVKLMLETTANHPSASQKEIYQIIDSSIKELQDLIKSAKVEKLYQECAILLAHQFYPRLSMHYLLNAENRKSLSLFVESQIKANEDNFVESSQRILALYSLGQNLPKLQSDAELKVVINEVYKNMLSKQKTELAPSSLHTFIHAELRYITRKGIHIDYQALESHLMHLVKMTKMLPHWREDYTDELEIFIWYHYHKKNAAALTNEKLLEPLVMNTLMDFPQYSFRQTSYFLLEYFKKLKAYFYKETEEAKKAQVEETSHKTYVWSIQNDMLCHKIHFDKNLPLLQEVMSLWKEKKYTENQANHSLIIEEVFKRCKSSPSYQGFSEALLKTRITILYKYFWYHILSDANESAVERFIKWHLQEAKQLRLSKEDSIRQLEKKFASQLPLTPFSRKSVEAML